MEILEKKHNENQPMPTIQSLANEWLTPQQLEADEKIVESCLAHTEKNQVVRAYERNIPIDTKRELMQWYAEHLNSIEPLGIEIN